MLCSQCGALVDKSYKYCPSCGTALPSTEKNSLPSNPPDSSKASQTLVKRKMPLWFKILTALAVIALIGVTAGILFTESLVDVIDNQLKALRKSDIESAYQTYTSKEFQRSTSPEEFRDFVNTYPILKTNQSAHFTQRSIEHNIGTIKGNLTSPDHIKTPIEYKLIKERGKWKILSIKFLKPEMLTGTEPAASQELNILVKSQLDGIKEGQVADAFENMSSKEFKKSTTLEAFQDFVKRYPILSGYDGLSFNRALMRKGVGIVSATLKMGDRTAFIKYYLVKEDGRWKIWSMRILSSMAEEQTGNFSRDADLYPEEKPSLTTFTDIKLGTKLDAGGNIKDPSTIFRADSGEIYVNVEIKDGIIGEIVHLNFQHLDSHSSILAKAPIEEKDASMVVSVFSPPIGGWPKGEYQLIVSSSKFTKTINFSIE
jgi:hypothetical protein